MRSVWLSAALIGFGVTAITTAQTQYGTRDEIEGSTVALAAFPIRPMAYRSATGVLWAINNHDNTLQRFQTTGTGASTSPNLTCPLPWAPVSVAYWEGPNGISDEEGGGDDELIVTCRGTWAVLSVSAQSGRVTDVIQLPASAGPALLPSEAQLGRMAEPGDVLIDSINDRAFVTCTASDSVLQIDLVGARKLVTRIYHVSSHASFRCKAPLFLSFDIDRKVLVSPLNSGNNSTWGGGLASGTEVIAPAMALPDEDLFRIDANANTVTVVATGIGSTIFAHGLNTVTEQVWVLNTNGLNRSPSPQSEPELNGDFLSQGIALFDAPVQLPIPPATIDLDPALSLLTPGQLSAEAVIGQPFALAFNKAAGGGQAFVAGLLTDNVLLLDNAGSFVHEFELPALTNERAIPRGVLVKSATTDKIGTFFVYAWGHNKVYEFTYDLNTTAAPTLLAYGLGRDPTSRLVRRGRAHFFDARNSTHKNLSCASCHVDGGSDLLVWNLSHKAPLEIGGTTPVDDKGGMVTQTLVGLKRVAPFHWRGERDELVDFNVAFAGLLGGSKLDVALPDALPEDFDEFQAFVFSLVNPANPNQQRDRALPTSVAFNDRGEFDPTPGTFDPTPVITNANPTRGRNLFNDERSFKGAFNCADCHPQPTGTNNGIHIEVTGESQVRRSRLKPAAFHELWRKDLQPRLYVGQTSTDPLTSGDDFQALLGGGITHTGTFVDLLEFVNAIFVGSEGFPNPTTSCVGSAKEQCAADVVSFIERWDSGLGQAAHFATRLAATQDGATQSAIGLELDFLVAQAEATSTDPWGPMPNCDIAAFGFSTGSATLRRWAYRRADNWFMCDDGTTRTLQQFKDAAAALNSTENYVFVGLPVGRGEGFGIDQDNDGHVTALDSHPLNPTYPGTTTAPSLVSGSLTVPWITTRAARLRFETDEPTTATVRYWPWPHNTPQLDQEVTVNELSRVHSVMLNGLRPSTEIGDVSGVGVPIGTVTSDVVIQYAGEIVLKNASGQSSAAQSFGPSNDTTTKPFLLPTADLGTSNASFNPNGDNGDRQRHHEHTVSESWFSSLTRNTSSGQITGTVNFIVSFVRGGRFNGAGTSFVPEPAPNRIVIGRVMSRRSAVAEIKRVDSVVPGSNALDADLARLRAEPPLELHCGTQLDLDGANSGTNFEGRLLLSKSATDASGQTAIDFSFTDPTLTTDDEVWFVIDAVIEVKSTVSPLTNIVVTDNPPCLNTQGQPISGTGTGLSVALLPALTFSHQAVNLLGVPQFHPDGSPVMLNNSQIAWTQWSFPDTGEELALVKDELP